MLFCSIISVRYTRKGKGPDPEPDPGGLETCGSCGSGSPTPKKTITYHAQNAGTSDVTQLCGGGEPRIKVGEVAGAEEGLEMLVQAVQRCLQGVRGGRTQQRPHLQNGSN
jgi:hypothetical protein